MNFGLSGLSMDVESLASLVMGGIGFATPEQPGELVATGHRFPLANDSEQRWLEWKPALTTNPALLAHLGTLPVLRRSELTWTAKGRIWDSNHERRGWLLMTTHGLLGCKDLLMAPVNAAAETVTLSVSGNTFPLTTPATASTDGLALMPLSPAGSPWPKQRLRVPQGPEDAVIIGDPSAEYILLSAARIAVNDRGIWTLDRSISVDRDRHGSAVVATSDGAVIGFLDCGGSQVGIHPLSEELLTGKTP